MRPQGTSDSAPRAASTWNGVVVVIATKPRRSRIGRLSSGWRPPAGSGHRARRPPRPRGDQRAVDPAAAPLGQRARRRTAAANGAPRWKRTQAAQTTSRCRPRRRTPSANRHPACAGAASVSASPANSVVPDPLLQRRRCARDRRRAASRITTPARERRPRAQSRLTGATTTVSSGSAHEAAPHAGDRADLPGRSSAVQPSTRTAPPRSREEYRTWRCDQRVQVGALEASEVAVLD